MEDKYIPLLTNLDSLELSEDHKELDWSDRSRCAAREVLRGHTDQIIRGEIELRTLEPKSPSRLIYVLGIGTVNPWGKICKGLFYVNNLNDGEDPNYLPLYHLRSFKILHFNEKFE